MLNERAHACRQCSDTGWITATEKTSKAIFAFKCGYCGTAERLNLSKECIPVWLESMNHQYVPFGRESKYES